MIPRTDSEILREYLLSHQEGVHTCLPGIVQKYNADTQTADILPAIKRPLRADDGSTQPESHPVIPNVKIAILKIAGTKFGIHGTLAKGDKVTLIFSELSTSEFQSTGEESEPFDTAFHSIGSPIALPIDITDSAQWTTLKSGNRIGIDGDDAQIDFSAGLIKIVPTATLKAARDTDPVKVTLDASAYTAIAANLVCATPGNPPTSTFVANHDVTGTITNGSTRVKIG